MVRKHIDEHHDTHLKVHQIETVEWHDAVTSHIVRFGVVTNVVHRRCEHETQSEEHVDSARHTALVDQVTQWYREGPIRANDRRIWYPCRDHDSEDILVDITRESKKCCMNLGCDINLCHYPRRSFVAMSTYTPFVFNKDQNGVQENPARDLGMNVIEDKQQDVLQGSVSLSLELFKTVILAIHEIGRSAYLHFDPVEGMSSTSVDLYKDDSREYKDFACEFCVVPLSFNWYDIQQTVDAGIYFDVLLKFFSYLPQKGFDIIFWPEKRWIQGINHETREATLIYQYPLQEDVVAVTEEERRLFPEVTLAKFPFVVSISRCEFFKQIQHGFIDTVAIHVGICEDVAFFYTDCVGESYRYVPGTQPTRESHNQLQGFNLTEECPKAIEPSSLPGSEVKQLVAGQMYINQFHCMRSFSFCCKSGKNKENVTIAQSPQHGMVITFPLRNYGNSKHDRSDAMTAQSFYRYRLLPLTSNPRRSIQPIPSDIVDLLRQRRAYRKAAAKQRACRK